MSQPIRLVLRGEGLPIPCCEEGKSRVILFNLCGHGMLDLAAYGMFLSGKMKD